MKKLPFVLFLLAAVILASGFSLKQWKSSLYGGIKNEAEKNFSALFRRGVTIESAGGIVVGQIELKGITFPEIGRAEKIVLNFNPVKYALAKGDIIPALTKITVIGGNFNVTRDKQGRWNFLYLTEQEPGSSPAPAFLGRLVIKNCRAAYLDQVGFRGDPRRFEANASEINGTVDLLQKGRFKFNLSGKVPELVKTEGYFDASTGRYQADFSGKGLGLEKWADYASPLSDLKVLGGTADIFLQITPPKIKDWPVSFTGKATINDGSARFQSHEFKRIAGDISIADESIAVQNLKAESYGNEITLNCRLHDFAKPQAEGVADIRGGRFTFSIRNNALTLAGKFTGINLAALAQNAPGIEGLAYGSIEMSGPFDNLSGKISAQLSQSLVFGQPMETVSSIFKIIRGEFFLENFLAASGNIFFSSSGKVSRDLIFDLKAEASGLRLAGKGILGDMRATLSRFKGDMRWKMNPDFIASPLKNLSASGEVVLTGGQIGEQAFDQGRGRIFIGGGRIQIEDALLQNGKTVLRAGGQTGIGHPTLLKLSGAGANLEDLRLFNHFLPEEVKNPKGIASFEVEVTGFLSRETKIASFEPLLNLTAKGNFTVTGGSFGEMPVSSAHLKFAWQDRSLSLSDCRINLPDSVLTLGLECGKDGAVSGSVKGTLNLSYLKSLTAKYGKMEGQTGFNVQVSGRIDDPNISASLWIDRFLFNNVYLDHFSGGFNFYRSQLTLLEPALFRSGSDLYSLSGNAVFSLEDPNESTLDLNFKILQADLGSAYRLFDKLQGEFVRRFPLPTGGTELETAKVGLSRAGPPLPALRSFVRGEAIQLYSANGKKDFFLNGWANVRREFEGRFAGAKEENLAGDLTGNVSLKGKIANLAGRINTRVSRGVFRNYEFDDLAVSAGLKNREIKFDKAVLSKGKGILSARGDYNINGVLFLHLIANNMPLDIMRAIFPGKIFKGNFNMNAGVDGPLQNLRFTFAVNGKNISLAGADFDEMMVSITKKNDTVYLHELSLLHEGLLSKAYGSFALSHPGEINMEANLTGNAIGIVNLFTDEIKWNQGSSSAAVKVKGTLEKPKIEGNIGISNGSIHVRALDSDLQNIQGAAIIENNLLKIKRLTGIWSGAKTRGFPNPFGLAGTIDLNKILAEKSLVGLDLNFSPTRLFVAFPNMYVGALGLKELSLKGPLYFDLSQGPAIKGKIEVNDAVITLSQPSGRQGPVFPLNFDLEAALKKNVYAVMGDVATLNLSNIFMNLEIASENLIIAGNLESPSLLGKIAIKRGTVNIFNSEFTLLSPETQKRYFPYDAEKIQENTARFSGEEGPAGVMPDINITASVNVENPEKDESGKYIKKQVNILARLKGTLGAKEEARGLKIALLGFREDKTKSPPEMAPAAYSEQDLKVMLLPDFIKTLAGIGRPEEAGQEKVDTNLIVADYLSSRVQTLLFRGIERQVEQNLGLESLTLEYNLGPKVREAMGIKEVKGFEEEKPAWSVGFVKGFTDRLFIDVRYSQGMEQTTGTGAKTSFNYQLTYKITPIWSIIYYREPISLQEISTGYQKVTLKSGFSLW